ncbi:hypothetical protein B0A48_09809 [Cryoendolithus antarcticus]|uniref:Vegetative cell wall protein gp1 n=1 Tax=Cryoendolithus antarcticus TaxID=1507870 RepID=A0A1V8T2S4_9PEZI|nr:hypothetical protein B0A48_09809 [Cryoendolithus antarcticus]
MFQTQYAVHPPYYSPQDYRTPPHTPAAGATYYSPRQYVYASPPQRGHARRAAQDATYSRTTYTTPRKPNYYAEPEQSSPGYHTSAQSTPQRRSDYVSSSARNYADPRYNSRRVFVEPQRRHTRTSSKHYFSTRTPDDHVEADRSDEYLPRYEEYLQRPSPYEHSQSQHREARADHRRYDQVPIFTPAAEPQARPRRASHASKPTFASATPKRPSTATKKEPAKATEEDARKAHVPAGYSYKNWDPNEEPILLLGSVFDANSLGKWIYDWTVFFYGPATPMSEVAGELWLLLIQLAAKIKRAEETMGSIRQTARRDLVDEFLDSGERLWQRFNKLLKICENYMWKAAKKESKDAKNVTMGKNSGCEFVDAIFGRDRELERTEKVMTGIRLWSLRFDANVTPILAKPFE